MVVTRRQSLAAAEPYVDDDVDQSPEKSEMAKGKTWAESNGAGDRSGAWGLSGSFGALVALSGVLALMSLSPAFAVYM